MNEAEIIGFIAAIFTSLCNMPQAWRTIRTREIAGLSLRMYVLLSCGLAMWIVYGVMIGSVPIIIANTISLFFVLPVACIIFQKKFF